MDEWQDAMHGMSHISSVIGEMRVRIRKVKGD
jgi:hypothetical protein